MSPAHYRTFPAVAPPLCEYGKLCQTGALPAAGRRVVALVFAIDTGDRLDKDTALRASRNIVGAAGLDSKRWTPRELRHTFVSVLSDHGMPIEQISQLAGHNETATTETVYWHQTRPVVLHGAEAMDRIFPATRTPATQTP